MATDGQAPVSTVTPSQSFDEAPPDVQREVLRQVQFSLRATCKAFRLHHDAGRESLQLKWPEQTTTHIPALLVKLPQLRTLYASSWPSDSINALMLTSLTSLDLSDAKQMTSVNPLAACPSLTSLNLRNCNSVRSVQELSACGRLITLDLTNCSSIPDVDFLASCPLLTSLGLRWCDHITDIRPLAALTALKSLDLSWCHLIVNLQPLGALTSLTSIDLSFGASNVDLLPLVGCTSLVQVNLAAVHHTLDLALTRAWPALASLDISTNDISALAMCTNLNNLHIHGGTAIMDCTPLAACTRLTKLQLVDFMDAEQFRRLTAACPYITVLILWYCHSRVVDAAHVLRTQRGNLETRFVHS